MTSSTIREQAKSFLAKRPDIRPGMTVRIHERIREGEKERTQIFDGLVIGVHRGWYPLDASFTVRAVVSGVGTEKIFPLHSPMIENIEVKKIAKIRRAKLNFLRGRRGKAARLSERFTEAEEFAVAIQTAPKAAAAAAAEEEEEEAEDAEERKSSGST